MVDEILSLPIAVAKGNSRMGSPGVVYDSFFKLKGAKWSGRTLPGLGLSRGCNLVLLSVPFLIESRNFASFGLPPVSNAAATDLSLADAFLLPPIAEPGLVV